LKKYEKQSINYSQDKIFGGIKGVMLVRGVVVSL
jgi:hypothetical protein